MQIGILGGTGPLGRGLALRLADAGFDAVIGSRDAGRAQEAAEDLVAKHGNRQLGLSGADNGGAARSDLVVMATPWEAASATVASVADALAGKVVVSVANALVRQGREMHALVPARGSVAAMVATAAPRALVAAAGHHLPAASLADLDVALEGDVLVCSDHAEATSATMALFDAVPRLRALDAGSLSSAAAVEAFTAVLVSLNIRYRAHSTLRLAGLDHVERAEGRRR